MVSALPCSFIIAKMLKQAKCPSVDKWIKKMWDVHVYMCIHTIFSDMDEPGEHYGMRNKPDTER